MRLLVLVFIAALSGCVSAVSPQDEAAVRSQTTGIVNQHTGMQEFKSPMALLNNNVFEGSYMLRGWRRVGQPIKSSTHQLYLSVSSNGWLFLNAAYSGGSMLPMTQIDRSVGYCSSYGCTVHETVGIDLTYDQLSKYASTGIAFQLSGQRGSKTYSIPAAYFKGYLDQLGTLGQYKPPSASGNFPPAPKI
jgi:hypothetical protein